jgi:hypothetical protein
MSRDYDYDRDSALDQLAEWEEEERMDEYYEQQYQEYMEDIPSEEERKLEEAGEFPSARIASFACRWKPRSSIDIAHRAISTDDEKPKYQKDEEYYEKEAKLDKLAKLEYEEQINNYDELQLSKDDDVERSEYVK